MTWTRLTFHGIVNDCDLGEVSVYTPSKGCVGLRVYGLHTGVRGHIANMCQASIRMAPYESLYGRPCRSSLGWTEMGESSVTGLDLIRDTSEKVSLIR